MTTRSKITGKLYDPDDVWYVSNINQIDAYNSHGAESEVVDILYNSRQSRFIFVYPKTEFMNLLYEKWINGEFNTDDKVGELNDCKET